MHCHWCGTEAFTLPEKRLDDGMGSVYCSQECVDKADDEYKPLVERGQAIVNTILESKVNGWNEALTWCAEWIESSVKDEPNQRTQEFAANMAMSIRAAGR